MIAIEGRIGLNDGPGVSVELSKRLYGWRRYGFFLYIAAMILEMIAWLEISERLDIGLPWMVAGLAATVLLTGMIYGRWCNGLLPAACRRIGAKPENDARIIADETGLRIEGLVSSQIPWEAVLMIAPSKAAWLFMIGGMAYFAPRRFFADKDAEKAFVAYCLQQVSPDVRARSREAVAFAG